MLLTTHTRTQHTTLIRMFYSYSYHYIIYKNHFCAMKFTLQTLKMWMKATFSHNYTSNHYKLQLCCIVQGCYNLVETIRPKIIEGYQLNCFWQFQFMYVLVSAKTKRNKSMPVLCLETP